jgi:hypothetical protein
MGYFHEDLTQFQGVHSRANPLGLGVPDWRRLVPLLVGGYRGLFFYAPILLLALPGWLVLIRRRAWRLAAVSFLVCLTILAVNLSYPEWTGGWSTGPRLLVPLVPFAMLPVAAMLSVRRRAVWALAVVLALAGAVLMLFFQGVGGRVPHDIANPVRDFVWPIWSGQTRVFAVAGSAFARNVFALAFPDTILGLAPSLRWVQFLPLVAFQAIAIGLLIGGVKEKRSDS